MATEFISNSWLMPENSNKDRISNYSLNFDGSAKINYSTPVDLGVVSTFSFWMNIDVGTTGALFGNTLLGTYEYVVYYAGSAFYFKIAGAYADFPNAASAISTGQWHHVAFVRPSENEVKCYIDSVLTDTITSWSGTPGSNPIKFDLIGSRPGGGLDYSGKITEISGFDYSLSASQVTQLYGTGSAIGNPMAITNGRKPVAYYPLGNAAFNGEFLTPNGAEQDFVFDFVPNGYIQIPSSSDLIIGGDLTISFWFKTSATSGVLTPFMLYNDQVKVYIVGSDGLLRTLQRGASTFTTVGTTAVNDGNWHLCTAVLGLSETKVYLDNTLESSDSGFTRTTTAGGNAIGSRYFSSANSVFDGQMSNVSVFNTALPATGTESVESLYNYGTPPNIASYSGLQAWWELDASATFDGSNWSIPDASSNSNTGTSSGMTAASLTQSDLIINQSYDPFSLSFDGIDERISFTETNLGLNNSISIWFKRPSTGTNVLIGQGSAWYDYAVRIESNGSIKYADRYTSPTITFDNASTKLVVNTVNTWINIVIVRTGSTANLYVNGVDYDGSKSWGSGSEEGTVFNRLAIGGDGTSYGFNGQLSNFASWNTSLTSTQALEVYNEAKPSNLNNHSASSSLVSWYRLGAVNTFYNSTTTEFTVLDEVGTNNGTSVNMEQSDLVDGVGATGSGTSSDMSSGTNRSDAPYSSNNAVSYNMSVTAKSISVPT